MKRPLVGGFLDSVSSSVGCVAGGLSSSIGCVASGLSGVSSQVFSASSNSVSRFTSGFDGVGRSSGCFVSSFRSHSSGVVHRSIAFFSGASGESQSSRSSRSGKSKFHRHVVNPSDG